MRTLIFAGIILASSAALAQSPAQKAICIGCLSSISIWIGAFATTRSGEAIFLLSRHLQNFHRGLVGRISYFESCPGGPIIGGGNNDGH